MKKNQTRKSEKSAAEAAAKKAPRGPLTGKQARYLRGLAHHEDPIVQLGKLGVTDGVLKAIDEALSEHELVKVRVGKECPVERDEVAEDIAPKLKAEIAQTIGRIVLLYRRHPKKPVIVLPAP